MTLKINHPYTPRPIQQVLHDAMDAHRFSVFVAHRRLGKTVAVINQIIKRATQCKLSRPRYGYIAPLYNQAKSIAWDYLKQYTAMFPGVKRNESELWVEIPSISGGPARIRLFGGDNPDALRGLYYDGLILDEVAQMKSQIWGEILLPGLVDREGWCIFIGTPQGFNLLYELYNAGLHDPEWYANIFPATKTGIFSEEQLEKIRKTPSMSEAQFRQEFLCDFTASSEDIFIPLDVAIAASKRNNLPQSYSWAPVVIGVDVARQGDDNSVIYVRQGNHTIAVKKFPHTNSVTKFALPVSAAIEEYGATMAFIDAVGVGAGTYDALIDLGHTHNVMAVNAGMAADNPRFRNKRVEMWQKMKDWLIETGDIPDDQGLISELTSVTYDHNNPTEQLTLKKKADMKKEGLPSPDIADALAYTFFMPVVQNKWDEDAGGYYNSGYLPKRSKYTGY